MGKEAEICAGNNVDWYQAVFRAHGLSSTAADGMWISRDRAPPYYSNAVTLSPADPARKIERIAELGSALGRPFSVKDSFAALDLSRLGFRLLFAAEWMWRPPAIPLPTSPADIEWRRVSNGRELEAWENAWRAGGSPAETRVFVPSVLAEPLALFAGRSNGQIVAGAAANLSANVVGFSNFFAIAGDPDGHLAGALAATAAFAPGLPIVGYERGEALARARRFGFRSVGPLRVWISADA